MLTAIPDRLRNRLTITRPQAITFLTNTYDTVGGCSARLVSQTRADSATYQFAYTTFTYNWGGAAGDDHERARTR